MSFSSREKGLLVAVGGVAAAYVGVRLLSKTMGEKKTRRGQLVCKCEKVKIQIYMPASNYKFVETLSFQCACEDCVDWADKVIESGSYKKEQAETCTPGNPNMVLYDSEICVDQGEEFIKSMKLSEKTPNRRIYSKCCGTPLGISIDGSGINMVNYLVVQNCNKKLEKNEVDFPSEVLEPSCCLHGSEAKPDKKVKPESLKIVPKVEATFMASHFLRIFFYAILGTKGPGYRIPNCRRSRYWNRYNQNFVTIIHRG